LNQNWLAGISSNSSDPCYFGNACIVDSLDSGGVFVERCNAGPGNCPILRQNVSAGFFGYDSSWPATIFKREIVLTQINANEVSVQVTVNWSKGLVNRQFKAKENLLKWQQ
ncbi:MAG: hypothetical protein AAB586_00160, partial [Patescibacteria group bacterium]